MERNSFIFYKSFYEASKYLSDEEKWKLFDMICQYWLYGDEIEGDWSSKGMFMLIKPQLDANNKRYLNWCKWWAPEWNNNAKKEADDKEKITKKQPKNNQKQPNDNDNDNVNDNVNDNQNNNKLSISDDIDNSGAVYWKKEINNLISEIRWECLNLWIAYDKTREREFWKHILTAKEYWNFCENIWQDRVEFALNILKASAMINYWKWICSWPMKIYQNYSEVYNQTMMSKSQNKNKVVHIDEI